LELIVLKSNAGKTGGRVGAAFATHLRALFGRISGSRTELQSLSNSVRGPETSLARRCRGGGEDV
jgi:hypothetical protein